MQTTDRTLLRKELRADRKTISPAQQQAASALVLRHLMQLPQFVRAKHIALYLASDGELDLQPVAEQLWKMEKHCYLPVVHPSQKRQLWFIPYTPHTELKPNRFGILEPILQQDHKMPPHLLDVVLLPLVGFDRQGARLGMGGGFYDTTFAFQKTADKKSSKPFLVGVAHACQEVESLVMEAWDVPLFGVATDKEMIRIK